MSRHRPIAPSHPPRVAVAHALFLAASQLCATVASADAGPASSTTARISTTHAAAPPIAAPPAPPAPPSAALSPADAREAIARALAFTVTIESDGVYGAGIVVAPSAGLLLTAHHVVEPMRAPLVTFRDGRRLPAQVVEVDRALDVALLRIAPQSSAPPPVGEVSSLLPGEEVYAVGCPRHLSFTVSRGIVSYVGRELDGARWLQTDLPINDGNSGGPVINARGELVGMMSFILRGAQGMSFALPVDAALSRFRLLRITGRGQGEGASIQPPTPSLGTPKGRN